MSNAPISATLKQSETDAVLQAIATIKATIFDRFNERGAQSFTQDGR